MVSFFFFFFSFFDPLEKIERAKGALSLSLGVNLWSKMTSESWSRVFSASFIGVLFLLLFFFLIIIFILDNTCLIFNDSR